MNEIELKERLMEDARRGGICAEGYGKMRGYNRDKLIAFYLECPDWCIERGFPSLELLRLEFSDIEDRGVFVDKKFDGELFDKLQVYVFHNCRGIIKVAMDYDNAVIPMLYFANGCNIKIVCQQKNDPEILIPVYVVDDGSNHIRCSRSEGCSFRRHKIRKVEP